MLVCFQDSPQHLARLQILFIHQAITNVEQLRERSLHNFIKVPSIVTQLESVGPTDRKQTLEACEDGGNILRVEQLDGDIDEFGPLLREVTMEDLLEGYDELGADVLWSSGYDGDESCADGSLLLVADGGGVGLDIFDLGPALVDAILEVDGSCGRVSSLAHVLLLSKLFLRTRKADASLLLLLEDVQKGVEEAGGVFSL